MLLITPKITEKAASQQEKGGWYTFVVPRGANKVEIKKTLEKRYKVEVDQVNTMNYLGKRVTRYGKKGGAISGVRARYKKAVVKLKEGSKLNLSNLE